jgi:hypothetical protein
MDASKYALAKGNEELGVSKAQAVVMEIADALRDMADEIESGARIVTEIQTFERAQGLTPPISILNIVSLRKNA